MIGGAKVHIAHTVPTPMSEVMKKRNVTGQLEGRKNPTNLKQHMSKIHPDQYAQLLETNSAK